MESPYSFLPASLWHRGLLTGCLAIVLTVALELTCWGQVQKLWRLPKKSSNNAVVVDNRRLYLSALAYNLVNNVGLGSFTFYTTVRYACQPPGRLSTLDQMQAVVGILLVEGILYYMMHKAFHDVKGLYWMHSYHHKFNTIVLPSTANAVSIFEYTLAYMMPIVVAAAICRADETSLFLATAMIGTMNLCIHTPWLEYHHHDIDDTNDDADNIAKYSNNSNSFMMMTGSQQFWMFVTANDHLTHHRKVRGNYGAPVFHMDRILQRGAETFLYSYADTANNNDKDKTTVNGSGGAGNRQSNNRVLVEQKNPNEWVPTKIE